MRRRTACLTVLAVLTTASAALGGALPTWDKKIDSPARFKVLRAFDGAAVVDRETGLVWEKTAAFVGNYRSSLRHCALRNVGGRMGWRLPALEELLTLVDQTRQTPALPEGAPFANLLSVGFWTANEEELDPTLATTVVLDVFSIGSTAKTASRKALCVRGGRGSTSARRGAE